MSLSIGLLTILTGLAIMGFGLFMFYAWLPVFYALVGFDVGILLGRALTGDAVLEPYRRVLLGVSGGILFGLSVSSAFGLDVWLGGFFGRIFALVCGAIGSLLMPRFFDIFVIAASAVSGAAMVLIGANHILPGVRLIDPAAGGALPSLITIILAAAGMGWQRHNIAKWVQVLPTGHGVSEPSVEDRK
jgi:hypothetical protein